MFGVVLVGEVLPYNKVALRIGTFQTDGLVAHSSDAEKLCALGEEGGEVPVVALHPAIDQKLSLLERNLCIGDIVSNSFIFTIPLQAVRFE